MISGFMKVMNEEELIQFALDSFVLIADQLDILSVVDNGSQDATLDIIDSYHNRLPIVVQSAPHIQSHGTLMNMALEKCKAPWAMYLDGDETFDTAMVDWLRHPDRWPEASIYEFYKYSTIGDCFHYTHNGGGPSQRMFQNTPGVHFSQLIHTEPVAAGDGRKVMIGNMNDGPLLFDATATKSTEALWAKGARYQWGARAGVEAVGPLHEYVGRVADAYRNGSIREFPENIRARLITGQGFVVK